MPTLAVAAFGDHRNSWNMLLEAICVSVRHLESKDRRKRRSLQFTQKPDR
jgi:hypothetical protein